MQNTSKHMKCHSDSMLVLGWWPLSMLMNHMARAARHKYALDFTEAPGLWVSFSSGGRRSCWATFSGPKSPWARWRTPADGSHNRPVGAPRASATCSRHCRIWGRTRPRAWSM